MHHSYGCLALKVSGGIVYKNDHRIGHITGLLEAIGPGMPILPLIRKFHPGNHSIGN